ncbi:hypothetical protein ACG83_20745 [Frankia sp. R43]|nr:hypothetical protein ACG83_20745 [Frankia sp. R43]
MLPYRAVPAPRTAALAGLAERLGFTSVWAAEVSGADAFAQLAAAAAATVSVELGTAIVPIGSRTPALLGMSANTLATLSGGRFALGIGVSSPRIMRSFHGLAPTRPLAAVGDALTILDDVLGGRRTFHSGEAFSSSGFTLTVPAARPPLLLAALGPGMRRLAGERADGVILNFVPASAAATLAAETAVAGRPFRRLALVRVALAEPGADRTPVTLRRGLASYLRVPPYARWFTSLGLGAVVERVTAQPDLDAMADALPEDVVRDLAVVGTARECARRLREFASTGLEPVIVPETAAGDVEAYERLITALAAHLAD